MDSAKIRMKIGDHEFEAEGTPESVQAQFQAFRELIGSIGLPVSQKEVPVALDVAANNGSPVHVHLEKIMRVQGRIVSLTAIPPRSEDSALLILQGNKDLRNNESVTGAEIGDGLAQSGRPVGRTDRLMEKLIAEGFVLKSGFRRGTRYRLSNSGHQKALAVARELIATLP